MMNVCEMLHRMLLQLPALSFEEQSTHFIQSWSTHFQLESGSTRTFAMATHELFQWLSNGSHRITKDGLVGHGKCTPQLADGLMKALDDSVHHHNRFAKQLAMLAHHDQQRLFGAFYRRWRSVPAPQPLSTIGAPTASVPRRTRFGKYKCIWPWRRSRASKWY
jgi:hypothetical protein